MAILHTHRRTILLLERSRIHLDEGRVVHSDAEPEGGITRTWNIPTLNSCVIVLGQGTSLSQAAARKLADDDVMVTFAGTGGTPIFCASQDYRPTERLISYMQKWPDKNWRLKASKYLQLVRRRSLIESWDNFKKEGFEADALEAVEKFGIGSEKARSTEELMGYEGNCTRELYRLAAKSTGIDWKERKAGEASANDRANSMLDHGNYLAYGIASLAIWSLGIPASLAVTHGQHRAGGLVFDIADVIKDAIVLPTAFQCAAKKDTSASDYRSILVQRLHGATWLDRNGCVGLLFRVLDEMVNLPQEQSS